MARGRINKIVGYISKEIAEKFQLQEYYGQKIVQSLDLYSHIHKHIHEFNSIDSFNNAVFQIDSIIKDPYFVYYESDKNSLLYFKQIDEYVCVVVKLKLRKNKDNYVATIYPLSRKKLEKFINKDLVEKYSYKELV